MKKAYIIIIYYPDKDKEYFEILKETHQENLKYVKTDEKLYKEG